jgi:transposase
MRSAVRLREDYSAAELRRLACRSKDVNQSRRLLSLAAVRDWVHRFNASGPEGLIDNWTEGPKPRLSAEQLAQFAQIVETGPDREKDGVVGWRRIDLERVIAEKFGVEFHERYVGKLLQKLGFSPISRGPVIRLRMSGSSRHSEKLSACAEGSSRRTAGADAGRDMV